jgi:hypothetical protein
VVESATIRPDCFFGGINIWVVPKDLDDAMPGDLPACNLEAELFVAALKRG